MATAKLNSYCDNCYNRHLTSEASHWCPECEEAFCNTCLQHHNASKLLRSHETVSISNNDTLRSFLSEVSVFCSEHEAKFELYCAEHQEGCCPSCVKGKHKDCNAFETIKEVVKGVKTSSAFEDIEKSVENLLQNYEAMKLNRIENINRVSTQKESYLLEIDRMRKEINLHLDEIESSLKTHLSENVEGVQYNLKAINQDIVERLQKMTLLKDNISKLKEFATETQTFFAIKILDREIDSEFVCQNSIFGNPDAQEVDIEFKCSELIKSFKSIIQSFGSILSKTSSTKANLVQRKKEQAQILVPTTKSVNDVKVAQEVLVQCLKKGNKIGVNSCGLSSSGTVIVFCDYTNKRVLLFKKDGTHLKNIQTQECPFDFTFIDKIKIALTFPEDKKVCCLDITSGKVVSEFCTLSKCYGIDFFNGRFFIIEGNYIVETNSNGLVIKRIACGESSTMLCVTENSIFSTISKNNIVVCYNMEGALRWQFQTDILKKPRTITVDSDGFAYVTGELSKNVIVISPDGKTFKEIIGKSEQSEPTGIYFEKSSRKLLVSDWSTGLAYVYGVSYN